MKYLILALFLASCSAVQTTPAPETPEVTEPAPAPTTPAKKPAVIEDTCPRPGTYQAVDLSQAVTPRFLEMMRYLGVKTIIRYGDYWPTRVINGVTWRETITGKVARPAEQKAIADAGFDLEVVFQHNNRWQSSSGTLFHTYTAERGRRDAEMMYELYPTKARWWASADFDVTPAQMPAVRTYLKEFKKVADKYGKRLGLYSSGYATRVFYEEGLIKDRWISMSTGFRESKVQVEKKAYEWLQMINKVTINGVRKEMICGGLPIDFNYVR